MPQCPEIYLALPRQRSDMTIRRRHDQRTWQRPHNYFWYISLSVAFIFISFYSGRISGTFLCVSLYFFVSVHFLTQLPM